MLSLRPLSALLELIPNLCDDLGEGHGLFEKHDSGLPTRMNNVCMQDNLPLLRVDFLHHNERSLPLLEL